MQAKIGHARSQRHIYLLFLLFLALLVGVWVRIALPIMTEDAEALLIHRADGGLFVEFAREIAAQGYKLPATIPHYTDGGIPFAYPPLAFYLQAIVTHELGISAEVARVLLPVVLSVLSVPLFYLLTCTLGCNWRVRILALFFFAISETAFRQQSESAGLAEAAGTLALIGMAIGLARISRLSGLSWSHVFAGFMLGVSIMASPGSAYGAIIMSTAFGVWQLWSRRRVWKNTLMCLTVVAGSGVLTASPYWFPVIAHHGVVVFWEVLSRAQGGTGLKSGPLTLIYRLGPMFIGVFHFNVLSNLSWHFLLNAAAGAGVVQEILKRRWWLLIWLLLMLYTPRESSWMVSLPGAILAGYGVMWLSTLILKKFNANDAMRKYVFNAVCVSLALAGSMSAVVQARNLIDEQFEYAPADFAEVLNRSSVSLPHDAKVISFVGGEDWTPYLIRRDVLTMVFGAEWDHTDQARIRHFNADIQDCKELACVREHASQIFGYSQFYFVALSGYLARYDSSEFEIVEAGDHTIVGRFLSQGND